jgi:hypothetical protein
MHTIVLPGGHGTIRECPHCGVRAQFDALTEEQQITTKAPCDEKTERVQVVVERCTACGHVLIWLEWLYGSPARRAELVYPLARRPPSLSGDIPEALRTAYREAWNLVPHSERAAAVMARRCLQLALRREGFGDRDLYNEIENAKAKVSPRLQTKLHYIRQVGLLGAHPIAGKSAEGAPLDYTSLVEVEAGEVEALFAALDEFFDEFYVRPKNDERQLKALNAKLVSAGKAPIKPPPGEK